VLSLRRQIELDCQAPPATHSLGYSLALCGRFDEAELGEALGCLEQDGDLDVLRGRPAFGTFLNSQATALP
jgi:hypothetical protein